jgi:hypothetical protein
MKPIAIFLLLAVTGGQFVQAQDRIYRCGNEYTNTVSEAQAKNCKLVSSASVTVVPAVKPGPATRLASTGQPGQPGQRVDAMDQRAKDSDARMILEAELRRAELRQDDLLKEYNRGEPEKTPQELREPRKYQERVADLKASISRNESDIAGIRRELTRALNAPAASAAK